VKSTPYRGTNASKGSGLNKPIRGFKRMLPRGGVGGCSKCKEPSEKRQYLMQKKDGGKTHISSLIWMRR